MALIRNVAQQQLAGMFNMSIPTLMIVRDRVVLFSQPGALPEAALEDLVGQAQRIDMDDVRAKIAEHPDLLTHPRSGCRVHRSRLMMETRVRSDAG